MQRKKLTLRPPPAKIQPHTLPPDDPVKVALSQTLGFRYIDRNRRYLLQARMVMFPQPIAGDPDYTWVDVPLVPEVYE